MLVRCRVATLSIICCQYKVCLSCNSSYTSWLVFFREQQRLFQVLIGIPHPAIRRARQKTQEDLNQFASRETHRKRHVRKSCRQRNTKRSVLVSDLYIVSILSLSFISSLSLSLSLFLSVYLSVSLSVYLSICLSLYLSI